MLVDMSGKVLASNGMEAFSEELKKLRGPLLSQQDLAQKSGIAVATISKLERGEHKPSVKTIKKLAKALGKQEEELLKLAGLETSASRKVGVRIPRDLYEKVLPYAKAHKLDAEQWIAAAIEALMRLQGSPEEAAKSVAGRIDGKKKPRLMGTPSRGLAAKNLDKEK